MNRIVIVGCGGHAKSIVDTVENEGVYKIVGFIDREINEKYSYRGYKVIGTDDDLEQIYLSGVHNVAIGVGYLGKGILRDKLYERLKTIGYNMPVIIDPTAVVSSDIIIGEGTVICKKTVVNADARIGKMAIINTGAIIEHECEINDFSHISVGTILCGNTKIGSHCFIGAGTTIINGIEIGNECIVGAGSVVLGNVLHGSKVYGIVKTS